MKVVWTEEAQAHLDGIYQYIDRDAPLYAKQTVDKLTCRSEQLIVHPHSGRIVPEYENKQLRDQFSLKREKGVKPFSSRLPHVW